MFQTIFVTLDILAILVCLLILFNIRTEDAPDKPKINRHDYEG